MIAAAEARDLGRVRQLLKRGANVHAPDADGRTALTAAAFGNHLDVARALIAAGSDVNAKDDTVQSPYLIVTSEVGDDPRLLEFTLDHGAKVNDKDSFNGTGLIRAAERGHARVVRRLLQAGIDRGPHQPARLDCPSRGDRLERRRPAPCRDGSRPDRGGVEVNVPDGDGVRPLAHAEERGYRGIADLLRAAGAR